MLPCVPVFSQSSACCNSPRIRNISGCLSLGFEIFWVGCQSHWPWLDGTKSYTLFNSFTLHCLQVHMLWGPNSSNSFSAQNAECCARASRSSWQTNQPRTARGSEWNSASVKKNGWNAFLKKGFQVPLWVSYLSKKSVPTQIYCLICLYSLPNKLARLLTFFTSSA